MGRLLVLSLLLACALPLLAATATEEKGADGHRLFVLQNAALKVVIDLNLGARVTEYRYALFKENVIYDANSGGGILMDHVWEQTWPGEFLKRVYDGEIVSPGPDAVVRVWTTGKGDTIKDIRLERTITLKGEGRLLHCAVALTNPGPGGRVTGYWSQNNFKFAGQKANMTWARPATRGIDHLGADADGKFWMTRNWYYVDDITAGWNAGYNPTTGQGILCLMDYNDLWRLYDNVEAVTTEWMYDKVAIPAGKTWKTEIELIPFKGMTGCVFGNRNLAANFIVAEEPGGLKVTHELTQARVPLTDVTIVTKAWGLKADWSVEVKSTLAKLDESIAILPVKLAGTGAMPAGIGVTLTGKAPDGTVVTETYGDFYGGVIGVNNDPFTMQPFLKFPRPAKQKVFLKPDQIVYTPHATPKVLFLRGIWGEFFRAEEAVKAQFPDAQVTTGWLRSSPVGLGFSTFPADYDELLAYDLIILGNVPAAPFDLVGQEMLADYVGAGGNVLVLGGDMAYGQGGFTNAGFLAAMPVEFGGIYNWRKTPGALKATPHAVTKDVTFGAKDTVYYTHLCTPKKDAVVPVTAGDRPILALGTTAKGGRIACILATPFGEAAQGETAFWDAPAWKALMGNTVWWLIKR
jgi:hypothetical protein